MNKLKVILLSGVILCSVAHAGDRPKMAAAAKEEPACPKLVEVLKKQGVAEPEKKVADLIARDDLNPLKAILVNEYHIDERDAKLHVSCIVQTHMKLKAKK